MELDAIAVFVKVVEMKSFSGAARLLKMPKTTVSAKIASLEKRLGVTLIQRTTRSLNVTETGKTYFNHCVSAIRAIELGESELLANQEKPNGLLKITVPVGLSSFILAKIINEYFNKCPDVNLEMIVTNRFVDLVGEGVDLAIRAGQLKDSTLIAKKFFEVQYSLWATKSYLEKFEKIKHPNQLFEHLLILHVTLNVKKYELTNGTDIYPFNEKAKMISDDFGIIKELILLNNGIGLLPNYLVSSKNNFENLVQVLPEWKFNSAGFFSFVFPGQKYSSQKVKFFIEIAIEVMSNS